jgi:hypothetical protein
VSPREMSPPSPSSGGGEREASEGSGGGEGARTDGILGVFRPPLMYTSRRLLPHCQPQRTHKSGGFARFHPAACGAHNSADTEDKARGAERRRVAAAASGRRLVSLHRLRHCPVPTPDRARALYSAEKGTGAGCMRE